MEKPGARRVLLSDSTSIVDIFTTHTISLYVMLSSLLYCLKAFSVVY